MCNSKTQLADVEKSWTIHLEVKPVYFVHLSRVAGAVHVNGCILICVSWHAWVHLCTFLIASVNPWSIYKACLQTFVASDLIFIHSRAFISQLQALCEEDYCWRS